MVLECIECIRLYGRQESRRSVGFVAFGNASKRHQAPAAKMQLRLLSVAAIAVFSAGAEAQSNARCSTTVTRGSRGVPCPAGFECIITDPGHPVPSSYPSLPPPMNYKLFLRYRKRR